MEDTFKSIRKRHPFYVVAETAVLCILHKCSSSNSMVMLRTSKHFWCIVEHSNLFTTKDTDKRSLENSRSKFIPRCTQIITLICVYAIWAFEQPITVISCKAKYKKQLFCLLKIPALRGSTRFLLHRNIFPVAQHVEIFLSKEQLCPFSCGLLELLAFLDALMNFHPQNIHSNFHFSDRLVVCITSCGD